MPMFLPAFAVWLGGVLASIAGYLATMLGKRIAFWVATVAALVALATVFYGVITGLVAGLALAVPDSICIAWGWFMPGNFNLCLSTFVSARVLLYIYNGNRRLIFMRNYAGTM